MSTAANGWSIITYALAINRIPSEQLALVYQSEFVPWITSRTKLSRIRQRFTAHFQNTSSPPLFALSKASAWLANSKAYNKVFHCQKFIKLLKINYSHSWHHPPQNRDIRTRAWPWISLLRTGWGLIGPRWWNWRNERPSKPSQACWLDWPFEFYWNVVDREK